MTVPICMWMTLERVLGVWLVQSLGLLLQFRVGPISHVLLRMLADRVSWIRMWRTITTWMSRGRLQVGDGMWTRKLGPEVGVGGVRGSMPLHWISRGSWRVLGRDHWMV